MDAKFNGALGMGDLYRIKDTVKVLKLEKSILDVLFNFCKTPVMRIYNFISILVSYYALALISIYMYILGV